MYTEVIFDLETQRFFDDIEGPALTSRGRFDATKLGVSVVSVYYRTLDENYNEIEGKMISFWEDDLSGLWDLFLKADRIIGFNSKRFDAVVLKPYTDINLTKLPHFDILEHIREVNGKRVSLNSVAKETLGDHKADDPKNAILYWQKRDEESLRLLKFYCEEDVRLTKEIYDYALKNKKLIFKDFWNDVKTIEVDFSYPKVETSDTEQTSLF
jgi:uncharacterized protein YprB with RNaseH-like and TPR domain